MSFYIASYFRNSYLLLRFSRASLSVSYGDPEDWRVGIVVCCGIERGGRRGRLSPRDGDQRKNYQGSKRGPGFGPVGDLPHVNKDRASLAKPCPA